MIEKTFTLLLFILISSSSFAQISPSIAPTNTTVGLNSLELEFIKRFGLTERSIGGFKDAELKQILGAARQQGIDLNLDQLKIISRAEDSLQQAIQNSFNAGSINTNKLSSQLDIHLPQLSSREKSIIINAVINKKHADLALASFISIRLKVKLDSLIFARQLTLPTAPSSQAMRRIKGVIGHAQKTQRRRLRLKSGEDWFSNVYAAADFAYTDYEDTLDNYAGNIHYQSLTFGGTLANDWDLSFTLSHDEAQQSGSDDIWSDTKSFSMNLQYNVNDNIGLGAYAFYADSDIEHINGSAYTKGYGALLSLNYDIGELFTLTSVHTLTVADTSYTSDVLYNGLFKASRQWNDHFNTGAYAIFTDSLRTDQGFDSTYWTIGADMTLNLGCLSESLEPLNLTTSYEEVAALDNYRQRTVYFSLTWEF